MATADARTKTHKKPGRTLAVAAITTDRYGDTGYDRRLSDKILMAFNHAYASGAVKAANHLKAVLADVDSAERAEHERRNSSAIAQADLWVAFVKACNGYNDLSSCRDAAPAKLAAALEQMKEAYRNWSEAS
ncbi:MAG: hypothetical protein ACI82H_002075 [Alphaproteobacteria bacterium]|jgi:hypothetical protein